MSGIVIELQNEISSNNCDIVSVLRRAHLIASKLQLNEFDAWIMNELNGYKFYEQIPDYRLVKGTVKSFNPYRGWMPVIITNAEIEKVLSEKKLANSISELISLVQKGDSNLVVQYPGAVQDNINKMCDSCIDMQNALFISTSSVIAIIEMVKNTVLEWTIKLESQGIIGEDSVFNETEKETAKDISQTINNYYGTTNVVNGNIDSSNIITGDSNDIKFDYDSIYNAVSDLEKTINDETISKDDKEAAIELLKEIKDKIENKKKPSIIKSMLFALKDFLINVGASITAGIIQSKIIGLF